jgi:hypothetical protein
LASFSANTSGAAARGEDSSTVTRPKVRPASGSIKVAECSSEALSRLTMSPSPYLNRSWSLQSGRKCGEFGEQRVGAKSR